MSPHPADAPAPSERCPGENVYRKNWDRGESLDGRMFLLPRSGPVRSGPRRDCCALPHWWAQVERLREPHRLPLDGVLTGPGQGLGCRAPPRNRVSVGSHRETISPPPHNDPDIAGRCRVRSTREKDRISDEWPPEQCRPPPGNDPGRKGLRSGCSARQRSCDRDGRPGAARVRPPCCGVGRAARCRGCCALGRAGDRRTASRPSVSASRHKPR